jgi:ABC-type transporter Mla maintaining outer membrane lipid asymmetry ATPase subunit MlaF
MENAPPKSPSQTPVIEMENVSVGSAQDLTQIVLQEVNWTVNAGEFWVIAGMHASGKTDLMWMTDGIMPPQGGKYRLFGNEMPIYGEELLAERLRVGMAFENGQLLRHMTVHENIALPLRYHRHFDWVETEERVKAMMEKFELTPHAHSMPGTLARDWQKRAGLARALMLEPELLLLDHPLGGLDMRHANWWLNFLRQWHAEQTPERPRTIVVTAEDLRPWRDLDCHFAILKKQRFISLGLRPKFHEHSEPLVKELLAEQTS